MGRIEENKVVRFESIVHLINHLICTSSDSENCSNFMQSEMRCKFFFLCVFITSSTILSYKLIRFSGAGIYFWWQAGAATYLMENHPDFQTIPVMGSSAGAIAASMYKSNAKFSSAAEFAINQVEQLQLWDSKLGLAGVWGPMVREFLHEFTNESFLTPDDLKKVYITVTPTFLLRGTKILSDFTSKKDLIDAVMASVHIPLFMDGKLWTKYKGKRYIDGSFWSFALNINPPLPKELSIIRTDEEVLQIDYNYDNELKKKMEGVNIVTLIKPSNLYDMMDLGYNYMKRNI